MQNTPRRTISYPTQAGRPDLPDIPLHLQNLALAIDADVVWLSGLDAALPASSLAGRLYWSTDAQKLQLDTGSGWVLIYQAGGGGTIPYVPIGGSLEWGYAAAGIPSWSILQYGQAVSRATYSALNILASAAGYPHGAGDGSTTFNIEDKRDRVSAGKGDMGGVAANRITAAISGVAGTVLGAVIGIEGVTLATGQMPSHSHGGNTGTVSADHTHSGNTAGRSVGHVHSENVDTTAATGPGNFATSDHAATGTQNTNGENTDHTHAFNTGGISTNHTHPITAEGGGGVHLNVQPTIIVNKIVRAL